MLARRSTKFKKAVSAPEPPAGLKSQWIFINDDGTDNVGTFDFEEHNNPSYGPTPSFITGKAAILDQAQSQAFKKLDSNYLYDNGIRAAFTVTGWFYRASDVPYGRVTTINRYRNEGYNIFMVELEVDFNTILKLKAGSKEDTYNLMSQDTYAVGNWTFFAFTYDDDDGDQVRYWIDKTTDQSLLELLLDTAHSTGGTIPRQALGVTGSYIGVRNCSFYGNLCGFLDGQVADLRVYDRALSQIEIEAVRDEAA